VIHGQYHAHVAVAVSVMVRGLPEVFGGAV